MFALDHLGIVVNSLEQSVPLYCQLTGTSPADVAYHDLPSEQVKVAMLRGNTCIELLESTSPDSPLARFLEKRGGVGGFHHWCFAIDGCLQDKLDELKQAGFRLLDEEPRQVAEGQVFFVHPKSAGGILTEFVEKKQ